MSSFPTDTNLLKQIENGYSDAVSQLILKYDALIRTIIREEVKNTDASDDVYSEVCLAIVGRFHRKGVAGIHTVDKWLKQVVRSKCKDFWRDEIKRQEIATFAQERYMADLEQEAIKEKRLNELFVAIDRMDPIYKDVVDLWLQEWTSAQIGEILGIPESTVKSRKRVIIRKVREYFDVSLPRKENRRHTI